MVEQSFNYDYTLSPLQVQASIQDFLHLFEKTKPNAAISRILEVMKMCSSFDKNRLITRWELCLKNMNDYRFLLSRLSQEFSKLQPMFAMVDWKPAELAALPAYKFGSIGIGLEAYGHGMSWQLPQYGDEASVECGACNLKWLGLQKLIRDRFFYTLKPCDHQITDWLVEFNLEEDHTKELELVMEKGAKIEFIAVNKNYSKNEDGFNAGDKYVFSILTNDAMVQLSKSFCYDYTLPPDQVRARIQGFLDILTEETNLVMAIIRVLEVMKMFSEILIDFDKNRLTQRDFCHKLRICSPSYFSSDLQVNRTIQDVVALLRCSPYSLGIIMEYFGLVDGLVFQDPGGLAYGTCGPDVIPTDLNLLKSLVMNTSASCIIVVRKHSTFKQLASDQPFKRKTKSILLTPRGYPDISIRFFLRRLNQEFPKLPIYVVVDWEPAGLAAFCAYKFGSIGMGLEAYGHGRLLQLPKYGDEASIGYGACNLKWLGLRGDDLELISERYLHPLKQRDHQIADFLIKSRMLEENYRKELRLMIKKGVKAEFEALHCRGYKYLGKFIAKKIRDCDYI